MAFLEHGSPGLGGLFFFCEEGFDLGAPCIQRSGLDILNLLIVFVFLIILVLGFISGQNRIDKKWIPLVGSFCCAVISIAYVSNAVWGLVDKDGGDFGWLVVQFLRAVIWFALVLSLIVKGGKSLQVLASIWWILFFLAITAINTSVLLKKDNLEILESVAWLVNFFLLICALRNISHFVYSDIRLKRLSEPLLAEKSQERLSRLGQANLFSKLAFSWVTPLLSLGYSKPLVLDDIPYLATDDQAIVANQKFVQAWDSLLKERDSNSTKNLVFWAIARNYWREMVFVGICAFLRAACLSLSPLLLYGFVNYSNGDTGNTTWEGVLLVGSLMIAKIVESISNRQFYFSSRRYGMRMRSALMVAVYQKLLRLSSVGRRRHSTGEVVNYIAVDAYRMGEFPMWFHTALFSVVQLFSAIGVLLGVVGIGVLPGLLPLFICGILNVPFAKILQKCQMQFMSAQDQRLRSTSEILNNMKIIKLQSWEEKFKKLIESYRDNEFKWLSESQLKKVYGTVLYWMSPTIVSSVVFIGCAFLKSAPFNAGTIFTILSALRVMSEPVRMIPEALSMLIQIKVSFDRINSFLLDDELIRNENARKSGDSEISARILNGDFSWDPESGIPTLKDINFEVKWGEKIAVCGPVGAGKSSLLCALLGEISKISGTVDVMGSVAYVSQGAWIQSGTIRDNILSGQPMVKTKYEEAIRVCALDKDIDSFDYGDLTEIGQRGLNMSGGQKQRIQLCRAVYSDADIYLLDDPFSAVDAHTAAILFNDCVMAALAKKTVILVTHQVEFLPVVDNILVMECGKITQSGNYKELLMAGTAFEQLVNAHKNAITGLEPSDRKPKTFEHVSGHIDGPKDSQPSHLIKENSEADISMNGLPGVQLTEDEEKEIGDVGWKPFLDYIIISKGTLFMCFTILSQIGFVGLQASASIWLAFGVQVPKISIVMLIGVYTALSTLSSFFVYLRSLLSAILGLRASKAFFSGFTDSIFNAPMLFFDSTPVGRILTRASSDLSTIDFDIPFSFCFVLAASIELVTTISIMASVTWQVLIVGIIATVSTKYLQGYYQPSARELMRINGTTKAPVMSYAGETALGVATIRAFNMEERFFHNYLMLVDTDASTFLYSNATLEWLILRTEAFQNMTLFTAAFLIVYLPTGYIPPGLVGLSLSYALALTSTQVFLIRWYCNLSNYIISVERIKQFMNIPPEPPAIIENNRPPGSWPSKGEIKLQELKIKYRPNSPLVLKGITCTFKEGTRVGIVGRTGSGKTTLITALFRLVEPYSGKILVDGIDICSIGLRDLRMKLSVIPQEPTLFKGSIRTNLDPLGLYTDDDIWKALEKCQLKDIITSLPNLLDSSVSDEGDNWSAGQRQLFCLGRVLLRRNKILILDEATASIDSATDAVLQKIIREEFASCTVITVAHRVPTVIDSDMVMVLSFGKLLEYEEPAKLMEDTNSSFAKLVAEYWSSTSAGKDHL
ncbi:ABC transporter C family member 8-like isoform X2 [Daucus carota subsp. sativus]|uniref:ABC transporter C family member 8-like isoform X2 n=1 Tax=Daucus carota subsp. sativus TaxID=79200 RepID=UPI0007F0465A|nr:PREDICTED: ABC transporter C family member 8-like isoform X2 [Daucus carota subsp. sativus]XP_017248782.1 PREDICTED: ABC transporter C family member 8-like isoform X2 [Daucus carota subsp. sativus]